MSRILLQIFNVLLVQDKLARHRQQKHVLLHLGEPIDPAESQGLVRLLSSQSLLLLLLLLLLHEQGSLVSLFLSQILTLGEQTLIYVHKLLVNLEILLKCLVLVVIKAILVIEAVLLLVPEINFGILVRTLFVVKGDPILLGVLVLLLVKVVLKLFYHQLLFQGVKTHHVHRHLKVTLALRTVRQFQHSVDHTFDVEFLSLIEEIFGFLGEVLLLG